MLDSVKGVGTIYVKQPKEYNKYEYGVEINGKKQTAAVEEFPNGRVKIKVGDGNNIKTIETDHEGLIEFNQKYMEKPVLYNTTEQEKEKSDKLEEDLSLAGKIMRNLLKAQMMMSGKLGSSTFNPGMNYEQDQIIQNQIVQQMNQQALQNHMTAVQMSTPGMGII